MEYIDVMENEFEKYVWRWDFIDFWASHMNTEENKPTEKEQEKEQEISSFQYLQRKALLH